MLPVLGFTEFSDHERYLVPLGLRESAREKFIEGLLGLLIESVKLPDIKIGDIVSSHGDYVDACYKVLPESGFQLSVGKDDSGELRVDVYIVRILGANDYLFGVSWDDELFVPVLATQEDIDHEISYYESSIEDHAGSEYADSCRGFIETLKSWSSILRESK